jgi:hypothetical protein
MSSPPGGFTNVTAPGNSSSPATASTAAPVPTNAMTGSNTNCGKWYQVVLNHFMYVATLTHHNN